MSAAKEGSPLRANTGSQLSKGCRYTLAGRRPRRARIALEEAKARLTIPVLWARLDLPGKPAESCHSPFREDQNPSFSVYDDGGKWHDFATGEGGDAADFIAAAFGVSPEEGCRCPTEMAGGHGMSCHSSVQGLIYVRPMRRKWTSCSTARTLSFNDELVGMPRELGDYVIVHELLHFSVPNHGKLWKSLMHAHLGPYEKYEASLSAISAGK